MKGDSQRLTVEEFIRRARAIHGDKYDYSKVIYINMNTPVCIICPIHGEFWQKPTIHLDGCGCRMCYEDRRGNTLRYSNEEFKKRANEVHKGKYIYNDDYVKSSLKIRITCPMHGDFYQLPRTHLRGDGCPMCYNERRGDSQKSNLKEFEKKAREIHGDEYIYTEGEYINSHTPIKIICKEHGEFWQKPYKHLQGHGCLECVKSNLEKQVKNEFVKNNIDYIFQHSFDWLKYKNKLSLDFYLSEYNIAIECQGRQHFEVIDFFGGEEALQYSIERDKTKKQLCEEHGIKLLYFSDKNYDEFLGEKVYHDKKELIENIYKHGKLQ